MFPFRKAYKLTSPFGTRIDPVTGTAGVFHNGIDIVAKGGDSYVYAAEAGTVVRAGTQAEMGLYAFIQCDAGEFIGDQHLGTLLVKPGQWLPEGARLGTMGSTGKSTGAHDHHRRYTKAGYTCASVVDPCQSLGCQNLAGTYSIPDVSLLQCTAASLRVRAAPGTEAQDTGKRLTNGMTARFTARKTVDGNVWYRLGASGWVSGGYVRVLNDAGDWTDEDAAAVTLYTLAVGPMNEGDAAALAAWAAQRQLPCEKTPAK